MDQCHPEDYREFQKHEFKAGTIIRAYIHEEDFNYTQPRPLMDPMRARLSNIDNGPKSHLSFTDQWGTVYSDKRYMIVVAAYEAHYLVIPLFVSIHSYNSHLSRPKLSFLTMIDVLIHVIP